MINIVFRIKFVHTYDYIISLENLLLAWEEFLCGKKNRKDVQEFQRNLIANIISLHEDLKNRTYKHDDYYAFNISDPKPRNIHKATVRDRLLHHAIYRILYPHFDKKFIHDSYSCRINKGTHKAMNRFRDFSLKVSRNNTRNAIVLKCDIRKFFASIDQKILKEILENYIKDKNIPWLLSQVIGSFSTNPTGKTYGVNTYISDSVYMQNDTNSAEAESVPRKGLPLGNLTSQLLVNIYMNEFDQFMKRELKVEYYIRYADDFVILHEDKEYLEELLPKISDFLEKELKLQMHPGKVYIKTIVSGVDFLGWVNFPKHRVLRTSTKRRILKRLKENPKEEIKQSYLGILRHGNTQKLQKMLE